MAKDKRDMEAELGEWETDAKEYEAKKKSAPRSASAPRPARQVEYLDPEPVANPIPLPHSGKPDYFPALTARSALFSASRFSRDPGADHVEVELACQKGYRLVYTGPRLNMHDKIVWETALQIAKERNPDLSTGLHISLREFAERMGWTSRSGDALKWIWGSLQRLYKLRLSFELPNGVVGGGAIISTAIKDNDRYYIRINPDFAKPVLQHDLQFRIHIERRQKLKSMLAQWLHDFLSTHSEEKPLTLDYLREMSGYAGQKKRFPEQINEALAELADQIPTLVSGFEIERSGRDSDKWVAHIHRGEDSPEYVMPEPISRTERSVAGKKPSGKADAPKPSRGKVAL